MNNQLVDTITKSQIRNDLPKFVTGDTIKVNVRIIENGKERIQVFQGVVIARRGSGVSETFIVRKMSSGIGVERTFPVNSPVISSIQVVKHGKVRRKKIYFIRNRSGNPRVSKRCCNRSLKKAFLHFGKAFCFPDLRFAL